MASTCAGHWSISTTSSPALVRSAATQLPFAPVPRTAIFLSIVLDLQVTSPIRAIPCEVSSALALLLPLQGQGDRIWTFRGAGSFPSSHGGAGAKWYFERACKYR